MMHTMSGRGRQAAILSFVLAAAAAVGQTLPPAEAGAKDRLNGSPRHGEWITYKAGAADSVNAYVVYPERPDKAPVVVVVHEIFGLTDWVRSVADQLAAEGFIAIAPDLLSGKAPGGKGSSSVDQDTARTLIAALDPAEVTSRLDGAVTYATSLPAASGRFAVVGFCWGGGISFSYATTNKHLAAAVFFYGVAPPKESFAAIQAPLLGLYGGSDARVTSTAAPAAAELKRLGKSFEYEVYAGAGHAFMRQQDGMSGANLKAAQAGWPRAVRFLKDKLETAVPMGGPAPAASPEPVSLTPADAPDACCAPEAEAVALGLAAN